ncbi:MAG: CotH kinase family protein [Pigmentiphaga sp.]|nr:CotH kinase family protein [Pigmentiphaga sp.]
MSFRIYFFVLSLIIGVMAVHGQQQLTKLPTLYLSTENNRAVSDKVTWIPGNIKIISSDISENIDMPMTIRGRGNSTWGMAKKPYRIKLDSKQHILNLPAREKNWVLLANYADKSLIRNAVAFKISTLLGFEFTPSVRFVDVYLNNAFLGNYMLTDQVQVGKSDKRVEVERLDISDNQLPEISGGYLLEIDGFARTEALWFNTNRNLPVTIKYPDDDDINSEQLQYIKNFTNRFENALFAADFDDPVTGYRSMIDTTSLINWYIACELTGNPDSFWSTFIYKKRGIDKFFFGPLWDFDIAFNNDNRLGDATYKLMRDHAHEPKLWIRRFWEDTWFRSTVNCRWNEIINDGILTKLHTYIDSTAALINTSQQHDATKWNVINKRVYLEQFLFPTYQQGVDYLKTYLDQRVSFLTESFASTQPPKPFVAEDYYYRIINRGTNNTISVSENSLDAQEKLILWSPVADDYSQQWKIEMIKKDIYHIINRNSDLAMTGNGRDKHLIQTVIDTLNLSQQWKIIPVLTGGLYAFENLASGYSINNSGGNAANGAAVIEYDNNIFNESKKNQHWYIEKVEKINYATLAKQVHKTNNIRIYPNPATDYLCVEQQEAGDLQLSIFRLDGQCVYTEHLTDKTTTVRIKDFNMSQGIYLVKIGNVIHKLIVD